MAGANPQRTSWTPDEVTAPAGQLKPIWAKPIEPYIPPKAQIIATNDTLYIATARGLYALDAATGYDKWVYATEMPLGHSPTVADGIAYVGGLDKRIHAVDAGSGQKLWTFQAGAGFVTNPLVVNGVVYMGSRDGAFYAVTAGLGGGKLLWSYKTGGPILCSAAYSNGRVYFASNDNYAYALDAASGGLVWKSAKLPGGGFFSWWPVIYSSHVIFSGAQDMRFGDAVQPGYTLSQLQAEERLAPFPNPLTDPRGTPIGPLGFDPATGKTTVDASRAITFLKNNPWFKDYIVLDAGSGQEDMVAPVVWTGTNSGSRHPPVVGMDGMIYQMTPFLSDPSIPGGQISGWYIGTSTITFEMCSGTTTTHWLAVDEPLGYAAGGRRIYWDLVDDRTMGSFDYMLAHDVWNEQKLWQYFYATCDNAGNIYNGLPDLAPGYDQAYNGSEPWCYWWGLARAFGGFDGAYSPGGDTNAPIPYKDKLYVHRGNSVIAFADASAYPPFALLPPSSTHSVPPTIEPVNIAEYQVKLSTEIQKILDAGHLRPGFLGIGMADGTLHAGRDHFMDYFHYPFDTLYTPIRALPYLSPNMQASVKVYLQNEFKNYPPDQYNHIGWNTGAKREAYDLPPDIEAQMPSFVPLATADWPGWPVSTGWTFNPQSYYAMWKYAQIFGNAKGIFDNAVAKHDIDSLPADADLVEKPMVANAFIAGYTGYLELQKLAGYSPDATKVSELNRLFQLRVSSYSIDMPYPLGVAGNDHKRLLSPSWNFINLVPEAAQYLHDNALQKVQDTVNWYNRITPYWFVSKFEATMGEGILAPLHHTLLFQAKAMILQQPAGELVKYLDAPGFAVGDLYYIQNLVCLLEAAQKGAVPPAAPRGLRKR